ncbi:hypothetical protein F5887DRAFT_918846 [Amanita rubescens]|nr:hypothetical protein F5887DRAFT_918846 [Amanita rubescens]
MSIGRNYSFPWKAGAEACSQTRKRAFTCIVATCAVFHFCERVQNMVKLHFNLAESVHVRDVVWVPDFRPEVAASVPSDARFLAPFGGVPVALRTEKSSELVGLTTLSFGSSWGQGAPVIMVMMTNAMQAYLSRAEGREILVINVQHPCTHRHSSARIYAYPVLYPATKQFPMEIPLLA